MTPDQLIKSRFPNASKSVLALNAGSTPQSQPQVKIKRSKGMNKTEAEYQRMLKAEHPECEIRYEEYRLRLADKTWYVPDFAIVYPNGKIDFVEVKGKFIFSRALNKPKIAAEIFPHHNFHIAQKLKDGWHVTQLPKREKIVN